MSVIPPVKPEFRSVAPESQLSVAPKGEALDPHMKKDISKIFADFSSKKNNLPKMCDYQIKYSWSRYP
jgi:hypothetical protein